MNYALLSLLIVCSVSSCLPKARNNQLVPEVRASTQTGQAVIVQTAGGSDQAEVDGLGVTSSNFNQALEESLVNSGLFKQIGGGGYQLEASIIQVNYPAAGFSVTTEIEVAYVLRRADSIVWRDSIRSSHLTQTGEALLGEFRMRKSTEGAVRENIRLAISTMSEKLK